MVDHPCPHGFPFRDLCPACHPGADIPTQACVHGKPRRECPKCDPEACFAAKLDAIASTSPCAHGFHVEGLCPTCYPMNGAAPPWEAATADTVGVTFLEKVYEALAKPLYPAKPPAPHGEFHIGFMSEADVAEVRRLIGV